MADPEGTPAQAAADYAQSAQWLDPSVPDLYADTVNVGFGPYGASLTFGIRKPERTVPNVTVHLSHQMAVVLERLMRRLVTTYELEQQMTIHVQPSILQELGVTDDELNALDEQRIAPAKSRS